VIGDIITLSISASEPVTSVAAYISQEAALVSGSGENWSASRTVTSLDPQGITSFEITVYDSFNEQYVISNTTDGSSVVSGSLF
jgi:hypothetical protein